MDSVPRTNPPDSDDGVILSMTAERIHPLTDEGARLASSYALRYLRAGGTVADLEALLLFVGIPAPSTETESYALRYPRASGTVVDLEARLLFAGIPARSSETAS